VGGYFPKGRYWASANHNIRPELSAKFHVRHESFENNSPNKPGAWHEYMK
jgi:hypothetical protein